MSDTPAPDDRRLADEAVRQHLITPEQLDAALSYQKTVAPGADLASVLRDRGWVNDTRMAALRTSLGLALSGPPPAVGSAAPTAADELAKSPPLADPMLGRTLAGEFRVTRFLGQGGMARVYLGEQLSIERRVAIKFLPLAATGEPQALARFQREAKAAGRLQHPNIVHVYFFGRDGEQYFMVLEYVEGESLAQRLRREGRLPVADALDVAAEVARALGAAHREGIVHRDVKPENIFLGKDGTVKLGDFGLARDLGGDSSLSLTGQLLGTPLYMAPEQCEGKPVDARADLYSLGATLFHLVTGRPPYVSESLLDILNRHVREPIPAASKLAPGIPASVEAVLQALLAKDPAARPGPAERTAEILEAVLGGEAVPDLGVVAEVEPLPEPRLRGRRARRRRGHWLRRGGEAMALARTSGCLLAGAVFLATFAVGLAGFDALWRTRQSLCVFLWAVALYWSWWFVRDRLLLPLRVVIPVALGLEFAGIFAMLHGHVAGDLGRLAAPALLAAGVGAPIFALVGPGRRRLGQ